MEKVVITGATGFLGSYICKKFVDEGYSVSIIIRQNSNLWRFNNFSKKFDVYNLENNTIPEIFRKVKPDHVIHTACNYGRRNEDLSTVLNTNLIFGSQILESSIENGCKTFINADSLLPKYTNVYSLSKAHFKDWLKIKSDQIDVINLKMEHIYGPMDDENKFVYWLIKQIKDINVNTIPLTSGVQKRDFVYIDDVVDAFLLTLRSKSEGFDSYDVGTGDFIEVKEFVKEIAKLITKDEEPIIYDKLGFGEVKYRANEIMEPKLNNNKLKDLGWAPKFNYKTGLKKLLQTS